MYKYLVSMHQDVCDFWFQPSQGVQSFILRHIDESKTFWDDLLVIQALRDSYTYRSQTVEVRTYTAQSIKTQPSAKPGNDHAGLSRNYNIGACTRGDSHISNGIMYNHSCSFCI